MAKKYDKEFKIEAVRLATNINGKLSHPRLQGEGGLVILSITGVYINNIDFARKIWYTYGIIDM